MTDPNSLAIFVKVLWGSNRSSIISLPRTFRGFVTDTTLMADLRKRFEGYIGKPNGEPVIR
jgi:hypothetical protein